MIKKIAAALVCLLLCSASACAETAGEITASCAFSAASAERLSCLTDGKYNSCWRSEAGRNARLNITAPEGTQIGGVYIQFFNVGSAFDVQTQDASGQWQTAASCETDYLAGYAQLPSGAQAVRIVPGGAWGQLEIAQIHVFGVGEAPDWVQRWDAPVQKADMLVISTHPDDELLFLGGTIPYYAAERRLDVQVAYLVPATPYRKLELLDGLWHCGVTHYPDLGPFRDVFHVSANSIYKEWGRDRAQRYVTGLYRRYRPEVVVAQDVNGEYGHGAHKVAAELAQVCIEFAADENWQRGAMKELEPWRIKKLYLHLYPENVLEMNWREPLEAFGGKTAFDIACEAFQCHISQLHTDYVVADEGELSCARFGLAYSSVGEDVEKNDFMEHIN